jgi:hypothetical protein
MGERFVTSLQRPEETNTVNAQRLCLIVKAVGVDCKYPHSARKEMDDGRLMKFNLVTRFHVGAVNKTTEFL